MARHGKAKARAKRATAMATAKPSPPRFTMQQEARNTEIQHRPWSNSNLRHKTVKFVSPGEVQRSEFENADREDRVAQTQIETIPNMQDQELERSPEKIEQETMFYFDSTGQTTTKTGFPDPVPRPELVDSDDPSEDEVVFMGRNKSAKPVTIETTSDELQRILHIVPPKQAATPTESETEQATNRNSQSSIDQRHAAAPTRQITPLLDEIDPLADYIANIDHDYYEEEEEDNTTPYKQIEQGGIEVDPASASSKAPRSSSIDSHVGPPRLTRRHENTVPEENEVQSSIDVLSKMYLNAEPNATPGSDDESEESTSSDEDDVISDNEDVLDTELLEALAIEYSTQRKKNSRGRKHSFPSASAFADALESDPYYGFDIMDFDRPSLQKKGKGRKPPALELMLSDSDMEFHLQEVWQSDRKKKKAKKKEREELRSQGLLGRSPGDPDLKVKYAKEMNVEDVITEIRSFLLSSKTSLSLPPMTKHRRKAIHELANVVNLKSQSRGNGPARFTMLLKTSGTPGYTRKTVSKLDSLLSGRKLNRRLFQSWGSDATKPTKPKTKRGAVGGAVSYMDGDVVGASAPEIGVENRGRAMLEKMGWSSGTALGASNNKGILQPVAHVVKNSRAGLG